MGPDENGNYYSPWGSCLTRLLPLLLSPTEGVPTIDRDEREVESTGLEGVNPSSPWEIASPPAGSPRSDSTDSITLETGNVSERGRVSGEEGSVGDSISEEALGSDVVTSVSSSNLTLRRLEERYKGNK